MHDELVESIRQQRLSLAATENTIEELGKRFEQMHEERNAAYAKNESMPQWNAIDYTSPETYPTASVPCVVAWDAATAKRNGWACGAMTGERLQMMVNYDDFGLMWADVYTGDFEEYDDISRPSHWCYAPNFKEGA